MCSVCAGELAAKEATTIDWQARALAAEADVKFLRERERHFANVLGVSDGGQFRNDWDDRLKAAIADSAELAALKADAERMPTPGDLWRRINDDASCDHLDLCSCWENAFAAAVTRERLIAARQRRALVKSALEANGHALHILNQLAGARSIKAMTEWAQQIMTSTSAALTASAPDPLAPVVAFVRSVIEYGAATNVIGEPMLGAAREALRLLGEEP